uniref:Uncharacterized protein n=1 Tax=Nelumbo nucifera TaxID=4432 RepID=A0A822Z914_NELNU|nr:TPA_asm: hypothetical protein HUJ06_015660 [Nelumbo nucifera]
MFIPENMMEKSRTIKNGRLESSQFGLSKPPAYFFFSERKLQMEQKAMSTIFLDLL